MPESPPAGFCAQCGAPLRANASFCTACGAAAVPASPASVSSAQTAAPAGRAPRSKLWLALGVGVLLLAVGAVALFLLNDGQQSGSTAAVTVPTAAVVNQDIPYPDVARVSPEQAHISAMAGDAVIVDVRGQEFFDQGHARAAVSIPPARSSTTRGTPVRLFRSRWRSCRRAWASCPRTKLSCSTAPDRPRKAAPVRRNTFSIRVIAT